jgi:serine/threonine protein phosphatase PrpC
MKVDATTYIGRAEVAHEQMTVCGGRAVVFTRRAPLRAETDAPNEDGALIASLGSRKGILAVADGAGGHARGADASGAALHALAESLEQAADGEVVLRESVLRGFEAANAAVQALHGDAATTLCAAEIFGREVQTFHVGDSGVLVVGQRGKRKYETVAHSPSGFAVEAGLRDEEDALHDDDRHVVLNMLGDRVMRIDMSARLQLDTRDTLLLASDGLFDNLQVEEVVDLIRKGPLEGASRALAAAAIARMDTPGAGQPSKPDDLTFILYRPLPSP